MDGDIRATIEESLLDFLHEESFSADLGERAVLDSIAGRSQYDEFRIEPEFRFYSRGNVTGLGQREITAARRNSDSVHDSFPESFSLR